MSYQLAVAAGLSDENLAEIRFFYWETDLRVGDIAQAYGVDGRDVCRLAGHLVLSTACGWCGTPERVSSRSERQQRKNWWAKRSLFTVTSGYLPGDWMRCEFCAPAVQKWLEIRTRQRQAEREEHERELRSMPYRDYLLTTHWQEVRRDALKRAHYRCQVCNQTTGLDVHHRTYERRGREYSGDVTVLCRACHKAAHFYGGAHRPRVSA